MKLNVLSLMLLINLIAFKLYAVTETKFYEYGYDSNGNTITVSRTINHEPQLLYAYQYNDLNQMVGFEDIQNQKSFDYAYYPDGRRLSKQGYRESDQEAIVFYYGHHGQLMNESYSKNNQIQKQSSYLAGLRFVDDLENHNDSHIQYPVADQHNHPATLSFAQGGSSIESYQLTDYGQLAQSNIKQTEIATQADQSGLFNFELNPKVYGSGYYDSESNLHYMGARYYSADIQRFMAQDSYNLINRYNYANANPVMNYDPDGHKSLAGKILGAVNYGLNASAIIGGGMGLFFAPEITAPILLGEMAGIGSGALGFAAQILSDNKFSSGKLRMAFEWSSFGLGILGAGIVARQASIIKGTIKNKNVNIMADDVSVVHVNSEALVINKDSEKAVSSLNEKNKQIDELKQKVLEQERSINSLNDQNAKLKRDEITNTSTIASQQKEYKELEHNYTELQSKFKNSELATSRSATVTLSQLDTITFRNMRNHIIKYMSQNYGSNDLVDAMVETYKTWISNSPVVPNR